MAREKKARGRHDEAPLTKAVRFAAIPLVVIILIAVILYMDRTEDGDSSVRIEDAQGGVTRKAEEETESGNGEGETQETLEETDSRETSETQEETGEISEADPSPYPFQQDAVLELTGLVQSYCEAKEECDPELLAWVFGISDWSEEEKAEEKARMELVKASVKGYENISCYTIQGPEADSYVIFPYYEIRYRETETLMPAFSWGYAKKDESGRYYMVQETDSAVNDYIRKAGEKSEVKAVMAQILARQQEAIAQDEVLKKIYGSSGESEVIIGGV